MRYHRYNTILDTAEAKIEVCEICKKKLVTRKDRFERIDNEIYKREHAVNFLQKGEQDYDKYYSA